MKKFRNIDRRHARGFTLLEILVVLVILGLLSALVLPNVFGKVGGAKAKAARTHLAMLQQNIDMFSLDVGRLPESLNELVEQPGEAEYWAGPYVSSSLLKDPWGKDWIYRKPGEKGAYDLITYGDDGSAGGDGTSKDLSNWD